MSPEFVVIDLSAISTFKDRDFTRFENVVIPHQIIGDILKSPDRANYEQPFDQFFRLNQAKIVVSHDHGVLEEMERGKQCLSGLEWIDEKSTARLRSLDASKRINWDALKNDDMFIRSHASRGAFMTVTDGFREELQQSNWPEAEKQIRANANIAGCEISRPYYGRHFSRHLAREHPTYTEDFWDKELTVFPDRYAVGRWSRILCWYGLRRLTDKPEDFGNNFDDAAYAFAASYAGGILTFDKRLKRCVGAVFRLVTILPT